MTPLCRRFATMAVAFAVTLMGLSLPAHAGLYLLLTDSTGASATITDIGSPNVVVSGGAPATSVITSTGNISYTPTGGFGGIEIVSLTVSSNYPGSYGPGGSFVQETQLDILNTSGSSDTIKLTVVSDGFTIPAPGTGGTLVSTLTNNSTTGSTDKFQSNIGTTSPGVTNAATPPVFTSSATTGPQGPIGGVTTNVSSLGVIIPGVTSYALANTLTVTIGAFDSDLATGLTEVTAVPEPATILTALEGVGLLLVGSAFRFRRRRVQT